MAFIGVRRALIKPRQIAAGGNFTTLDSSFGASQNTFSNGNLTLTSKAVNGTARSTVSHATGLYYWEITIGTAGSVTCGVCDVAQLSTNYVGANGDGAGAFSGGGWLGTGLLGTTTSSTFIAGHVLGIAVNATTKKIWVKDITAAGNWNANGTADPAAGVNGCDYSSSSALGSSAVFAGGSCNNSGDNITFNFGASAYAGTAPSGFGNF